MTIREEWDSNRPARPPRPLLRTLLQFGETLVSGGESDCVVTVSGDGGATWAESGEVISVREWRGLDADLTNTNQKTRLLITGAPTGGTITVTVNGVASSTIAHSASAATVASTLAAISSVGTGNVTCTGGPFPNVPIDVVFLGDLEGIPVTVSASSSLTGGTSPGVTATTVRAASRLVIIAAWVEELLRYVAHDWMCPG